VIRWRGLPNTTRRSGLGNLTDRAGELGGTMRATEAKGGGTEPEWRVPPPANDSPGSVGS